MFRKIFRRLKLIFIPCGHNKYRPEFLSGKFLFYYTVVLLLLKLAIIPFFLCFPESIFFADLTKTSLFEFTNSTRESLGLQPLKENPLLNTAAFLKARDMLEKNYFSHQGPEGLSPWYWFREVGYNYRSAGENLAIGFLDSEQVHQAWMNSSTHKENILNPNYQEIGIAVLKGDFQGNETTLVVQLFGFQKTAVLTEEVLKIPAATEEEKKEQTMEEPAEEKETLTEIAALEQKEVISAAAEEEGESEKTPFFFFFQFMAKGYYDLLQKIIYGSLIFVIVSLFLTFFCDIFIYRRFEIQYKDIIFETIGFTALWFVLVFLDKLLIIQIITDNFRIN